MMGELISVTLDLGNRFTRYIFNNNKTGLRDNKNRNTCHSFTPKSLQME